MSLQPDVSVVVPVYNVERYLPECIESLINQTYRNIKIILVNDGSIDASGKICDEYQKLDSRITVIHKKNEGQHIARLTGLKAVRTQYTLFCDSDDFFHTQMIEILVFLIKKYNAEFCCCDYQKMYKKTKLDIKQIPLPKKEETNFCREKIKERRQLWGAIFFTKDLLFSFESVPIIKTVGEDTLVVQNYLNNIKHVVCVPEKLYFYRQRKSSAVYNRGGGGYRLGKDLVTVYTYCPNLNRNTWDSSLISALVFCDVQDRKILLEDINNLFGPITEKNFSKFSLRYWQYLLFRCHFYKLLRMIYFLKDIKIKTNNNLFK